MSNPHSVTATISTLNRADTTLPLALMGIVGQTVMPDRIQLFDDGREPNLAEHPVLSHIFRLFDRKNISWEIIPGQQRGQTVNHQAALDMCTTECIWRLDDDSVAEPRVLEILLGHLATERSVGAVGGLVLNPKRAFPMPAGDRFNQIKDILTTTNIQWCDQPPAVHQVDHLYSTFLYRVCAATHGYCDDLSVVGHREETIFTYEMKRAGWDILVDTSARLWDMQQPAGGTRLFDGQEDLFEHNEAVFMRKLSEWGVTLNCR